MHARADISRWRQGPRPTLDGMTRNRKQGEKRPENAYTSGLLTSLRKELGLTMEVVASRLGVDVKTYAALEKYKAADENHLRDRLLSPKGARKLLEGSAEFQELRHEEYRDDLAKAFGVSRENFSRELQLPYDDEVPHPEDGHDAVFVYSDGKHRQVSIEEADLVRPRYPYGVPQAPTFAIHGVPSMKLHRTGELELAEKRSLGLIRVPVDFPPLSGLFAYTWTEEFAGVLDGPELGELMFIDTTDAASHLEEGELYVIVDRGEVLLRRAVQDDQGKWWCISGHWNEKRHRSLKVTRKDSRVYGRARLFRHMMRDHLRGLHKGEDHDQEDEAGQR